MNTFKKAKVVMLPTNQESKIFKKSSGLLEYNIHPPLHGIKDLGWIYQHLYIISNDEIKEGDLFINKENNIKECFLNKGDILDTNGNLWLSMHCHKIIATTDTSLNSYISKSINKHNPFPQPSEPFIQIFVDNYNKGNIITDIMVEYGHGNWEHETNVHRKCVNCGISNHKLEPYNCNCDKKIKINPKDNTITIRKIKDSWSREEVESLLFKLAEHYAMTSTKSEINDFNNWIKNNL